LTFLPLVRIEVISHLTSAVANERSVAG